ERRRVALSCPDDTRVPGALRVGQNDHRRGTAGQKQPVLRRSWAPQRRARLRVRRQYRNQSRREPVVWIRQGRDNRARPPPDGHRWTGGICGQVARACPFPEITPLGAPPSGSKYGGSMSPRKRVVIVGGGF